MHQLHKWSKANPTKLKYKLINIQLEYEMIRSGSLADEARSICTSSKEFVHDHVCRDKVITKGLDTKIYIKVNKVNAERRSMKVFYLLFIEPYTGGTRDSEKYTFPDLKKVSIAINR